MFALVSPYPPGGDGRGKTARSTVPAICLPKEQGATLTIQSIYGAQGELITVQDLRQSIIDAAVTLFGKAGYANVEVHDILKRAGITKGAFFSHFPTKDALAAAIISEADVRTRDVELGTMSSAASALENLIVATLVVADMTMRDDLTRVANVLRQRFVLSNPAPPEALCVPSWSLTEAALKTAIADGDLLDDIDVDATTLTIRSAVLGTTLLSDATADDVFGRIARVWQVLLRGNVPPHRLPHFEHFVTRVAARYHQTYCWPVAPDE